MLAVVLALSAAAVFGTANALQHRAASDVPRPDLHAGHLLSQLRRRPSWVVGLALSGIAFGLHVLALRHGPLATVQPIVVTTVVFAVLVRSALDRSLPDRAEIAWCVCTWVGLVLFVATARLGPPRPPDSHAASLFMAAGAALAASAVLCAGRTRVPTRRGFLLGVAAGVLYGLTAGLIKMVTSYARHGLAALVGHWPVWLVVPTGLAAFLLSQRAFQATRLSVSAPVLNIIDVLVAVAFGSVVFDERLFSSLQRIAVELLGAIMMVVGVWRLVLESERLHARQLASAPL